MKHTVKVVLVAAAIMIIAVLACPGTAAAQEHAEQTQHEDTRLGQGNIHYANQILVFLGGTWENVEGLEHQEKGFTFGVEYIRELGGPWAVSGVVERADGDIRGTLLIAQVYYNLFGGLAFVTGPGVEFRDSHEAEAEHHGDGHALTAEGRERDTTVFVYRIGLVYDVKIDRLIIAPTFAFDFVGRDTALVGGVLIGYEF